MTSNLVEDNSIKYSCEKDEEPDESGDDEEVVQSKEDQCEQKEQCSWAPSFFYKLEKEMYHFVGQDIIIQEALDSYAASTWPAASALCRYLESHCKELNLVDMAVLEIGSGTGLVSIVAALLGAWVTATDLPDTLSNLRLNLSKNTRGKCRHTPQVAALSWSFDLERTYPTSVYHYDYVLAADVAYHHKFLNELLATMKHFCQRGTKILWANKIRMVNDMEFAESFTKTFNTKLVFEDGDMKIFMATCKEDEEQKVEEKQEEPKCEIQVEDRLEKGESDFLSKDEGTVTDQSSSKELVDDENDPDIDEEEKEEKGEEEKEEERDQKDINDEKTDSKEDMKGQSTLTLDNELTLKTNKESEKIYVVEDNDNDDEDDEEQEEEEESGDENVSKKDVSPGSENTEDKGQVEKVKTFSWSASVISSFGKDTYHYVGTDINIYECIDFNESSDPFGTTMWPGALALSSFLENNRDLVNLVDKQVLELGAGTGLVAIVASLLGAKVTATDLPDFLGNLRANVMRNTRGRSKHTPQISPLTWSFDIGRIYPSHLYQFDFVLAADVVYHHKYLDELLATMSHFCNPRTIIIWANKVRLVTDIEFTERFKKEFNTTLLAEDGAMKIFMGKFKTPTSDISFW